MSDSKKTKSAASAAATAEEETHPTGAQETAKPAEEVAVSVDAAAVGAIEDAAKAGESPEEIVNEALNMADMVAEGGPVVEPVPAVDDVEEVAAAPEAPTEPEFDPALAGPVDAPLALGPANPSPDGTMLAFLQEDENHTIQLWIYAVDGASGASLSLPFEPVIDVNGPQWSPDGAWLAVVGRMSSGSPMAVWLVPVEGGDCVLVSYHDADDREPRWSPDGSLLAFVSRRDSRDSICISPPDGLGPILQMTYGHPGQDDREPCWSEDSSRIAFLRRTIDGDSVGDHVWTVALANGELKQATKKVNNRRSLRWCPGKAQIAFVTDEGEWENIGVVNPDNGAGWNLASEAGDKGDPQYSPDGGRLLYTRALRGEIRVCERPTSGANAETLDEGGGVASSPRWLPDKQVIYRFQRGTGAPGFVIQGTTADAERRELPVVSWSPNRPLVAPTHVEFEAPDGLKLGGLLYRDPTLYGAIPTVLVLTDEPFKRNVMDFRPLEQALAASGFAVFVPTLPGSPGLGRKASNALRDSRNAESSVLDIVAAIDGLADIANVDGERIGLVGLGYGGATALLAAGLRPGLFGPIVAIDPMTDWDDEFDQGSTAFREWHARNFGLPVSTRGEHAMRSPATFVGVIESPTLVIETDTIATGRKIQIESLLALAAELDTEIEHERSQGESPWLIAERAAAFLRAQLGDNPTPPDPSEAIRTDDI